MRKNISWNLVSKYRTELMGCSILGIILFHWYENCMIHGKSINFILHLFSLGNRFVEVFLILFGMGLYYSFKKQENIKTFYLRRITKLLPTYLILGIPYWIYFDCFLNKMNIGQVFIDISFISFITEGNRRFWFIGLILGLYLFFPIFYKIIYKNVNEWIGVGEILILYFLTTILVWKSSPTVYANIEVAWGRIPCFIVGIVLGKSIFEKKRIGLKTFLGIGIGLLGVFWGLKISEHVLITNIINRSLFGIVLGLIFLLILIIMMNALECFLIYEKFIRKILAFLGNITMEVYILHVAFRSIFDYPAEIGKYMILIGASILIAIPVNRIGKYIVNINRLRR